MANYYAAARTNYFAIINREAFELDLQYIPDIEIVENNEGDVGIIVSGGDYGGFPGFIDRDMLIDDADFENDIPDWILSSTDSDVEIDLPAIVSKHLKDGEVAIFMESGAEKLRYVTGYAIAVNSEGDTRTIVLNDIYDLAQELTTSAKPISVAEY